jgi:L-fucose isomerase-like protein
MMMSSKTTFAVCFADRGFFPASLQSEARMEMQSLLEKLGHGVLMMDGAATPHGAVESTADGRKFAAFLRDHQGEFGGVILCLPNFGDENGAVEALRDAGVPILIHAYPDRLDMMSPDKRRDAFCGKFSIMDVFCQHGVTFTALRPHVVSPASDAFTRNVAHFDALCRVVGGMKRMTLGAIGARTTAFKTVRIDELALQTHGVNTETIDLSDVMARMRSVDTAAAAYTSKAARLREYADCGAVPDAAMDTLARLGVTLDALVAEYEMDALALRCWIEMQTQLGISPCLLLSEMNDRGVVAACELDLGNALTMRALNLATGRPAACLDWNNNYGEDESKCILFHCGPVPNSMMAGRGLVEDHAILANAVGKGCSWGCNTGRIAETDFTFASAKTSAGRIECYLGQGRFTSDPISADFFGCAGVAQIENLQVALQRIGHAGYRHHVSVSSGTVLEPVKEAFEKYLGYDVEIV